MKGIQVKSYKEFMDSLKGQQFGYLLLYKSGSEQSDCALDNLNKAAASGDVAVMLADVNTVRDIHPVYNIDSVPSLIEMEKGELRNIIKGCHQKEFYQALFSHSAYEMKAAANDKPQKRVTVYSTPSCPWCTTLKNYLKKNGIRFSDVDVSRDTRAAEEMVRKSGQQGVPQTDINGSVVIGFDQKKLNQLLEIKVN
jgi:glutaredoxin-like YruB-family protein